MIALPSIMFDWAAGEMVFSMRVRMFRLNSLKNSTVVRSVWYDMCTCLSARMSLPARSRSTRPTGRFSIACSDSAYFRSSIFTAIFSMMSRMLPRSRPRSLRTGSGRLGLWAPLLVSSWWSSTG
jgi:hypothetical protein